MSLRVRLADFAHRRAKAQLERAPKAALRWFRLAGRLALQVGEPHRDLVALLKAGPDRWGAVRAAQDATSRFSDSADAWLLLGEAFLGVYRQQEALSAFEQGLALEERADAAMSAGRIYRRLGRHAEAAARFARAHAAGGGAEALLENARSLYQAGDREAADEALTLWAAKVPDGATRLPDLRAQLIAETS